MIKAVGYVPCERFMINYAGYGGHHSVPAIMFRMRRPKYHGPGVNAETRPAFAYEWR